MEARRPTYEDEVRENQGLTYEELASRPRVLAPDQTYESITRDISDVVFRKKQPREWFLVFFVSFALVLLFLVAVTYLFVRGVGIWGINIPVAWAFAIVNFVWWIGIGHAGTLISAILFLFREDWRKSINRFAEAMTIFAVMCAGLFPLLHLGRPEVFYWLFPYPNTLNLWPQFRSPLVWDVFAVSTYFTISLIFWYVGLIPDLASMRDRAKNGFVRRLYSILSWGWRGSARHWHRYETVYLLLAGLATPLVISVHSVVGLDFAVAILPGWHTTIFPPYFVAGAIFSGFAMVLTLVIPIRSLYDDLKSLITVRHLDYMGRIMLVTGLIVAYGYMIETFLGWYSGDEIEAFAFLNRMTGPYAVAYWAMITCNVLVPQSLWSSRVRTSPLILFIVSILINVGMWLERFVIIVTSLHRDYLPSSWGMFNPTFWDWATFIGTIGLFVMLMFLFLRVLPSIAMFETRELIHVSDHEE